MFLIEKYAVVQSLTDRAVLNPTFCSLRLIFRVDLQIFKNNLCIFQSARYLTTVPMSCFTCSYVFLSLNLSCLPSSQHTQGSPFNGKQSVLTLQCQQWLWYTTHTVAFLEYTFSETPKWYILILEGYLSRSIQQPGCMSISPDINSDLESISYLQAEKPL